MSDQFSGLYLNSCIGYPQGEYHCLFKEISKNTQSKYVAFTNGTAVKYTQNNPFGSKAYSLLEKKRAEDIAEFLDLELIEIHPTEKRNHAPIDRKLLEFSVMSTISSFTRHTKYEELPYPWKRIFWKLLDEAENIYDYFRFQANNGLTLLRIFNGRHHDGFAARLACIDAKIDYVCFETKGIAAYFETKNYAVHNVEEHCRKAKKFFVENRKTAHERVRAYMELKVNGQRTYEKSYVSGQKNGIAERLRDYNKKLIAVFPSSDDEYRFLGKDYGAPIVDSQLEELIRCVNEFENSSEFEFFIRLHPNMLNQPKRILKSYRRLEKEHKNVKVIMPWDKTSTYEVIRLSDFVICFCSNVGAEAAYMNKKVIGIGGNGFYFLPVVNQIHSGSEVFDLVVGDNAKTMSKLASIIYLHYLAYYQENNSMMTERNFPAAGGTEFKFKLPDNKWLKFKSSHSKIWLYLVSNFDKPFFIPKMLKYGYEYLLGKYRVRL